LPKTKTKTSPLISLITPIFTDGKVGFGFSTIEEEHLSSLFHTNEEKTKNVPLITNHTGFSLMEHPSQDDDDRG